MSLWKWFFSIVSRCTCTLQMNLNKTELSTHWRALLWNPAIQSRIYTYRRYLLCSRSVQKMSKKEKKLENIKQHWLSYPLFICALVEFFWSPENLQFLWFSIFLMCLLVSVCFVWCWIYLWDHLTNNWHFRAYIIKGFCVGWGGVLYYIHLSFLLSFGIFFLWFI